MPYFTPKLANVSVSSAGTRTALASSSTPCRSFTVQAKPGNVGNIYIGDNSVASSKAIVLTPGNSYNASNDGYDNKLDLSNWYIDSANNNDGVIILYF